MKKTLIALLALTGVAMAANVPVVNDITFGGSEHAADRLDLSFGGSGDGSIAPSDNRTVTITTTSDATISGTNGYGMANAGNILNLNITGTLTATGTFMGTGNQSGVGTINITTTVTADELSTLINSPNHTVSREILAADYISCLSNNTTQLNMVLNDLPDNFVFGGTLVQYDNNYYSTENVTFGGAGSSYWRLSSSAEAVSLQENTYYTFIKVTATDTLAAPKAIGFVAVAPEPATATLSLLALAGLMARRRRH